MLLEISPKFPNLPKSRWPVKSLRGKDLGPDVRGQVLKSRAGFKAADVDFKRFGVNSLGQLGDKFFGSSVVEKSIGKKANAYQDYPFQDRGVVPENDLAYQELLLCV
jgi:hypothetical protein